MDALRDAAWFTGGIGLVALGLIFAPITFGLSFIAGCFGLFVCLEMGMRG